MAVLDAFHMVKLRTQALDEVHRRVQPEIHGHRSRKHDPLYGIRTILRCGAENLTDRQTSTARSGRSQPTNANHEMLFAWLVVRPGGEVDLQARNPVEGRRMQSAWSKVLPTCPIPEIRRLGMTPKRWREAFPAYFDTGRASNGGTEATSGGLIEPHRASPAPSATANYRLRAPSAASHTPTSGRKSPKPSDP